MHGIEGRERGGNAERERCQEMDSQIVERSTHKHEKRESIISQIEKYRCLLHPQTQIQMDAVENCRARPRTIAKFVFCFQGLFREKVEEEEEEAGGDLISDSRKASKSLLHLTKTAGCMPQMPKGYQARKTT